MGVMGANTGLLGVEEAGGMEETGGLEETGCWISSSTKRQDAGDPHPPRDRMLVTLIQRQGAGYPHPPQMMTQSARYVCMLGYICMRGTYATGSTGHLCYRVYRQLC